jgi:hypothetical protein
LRGFAQQWAKPFEIEGRQQLFARARLEFRARFSIEMAIYRLAVHEQKRLSTLPDSGMGFQVVWGEISSTRTGRFIVLDTLLVLRARTRGELRDQLSELSETSSDDFDEVPANTVSFSGTVVTIESRLPSKQVSDSVGDAPQLPSPIPHRLFRKTALIITRTSSSPQAFFRYSARRRDPRVDPKTGDFASGTYAAPWSEAPLVPSGFAAVARYALPNPFAARRVYTIVTDSTPQVIGAAAPNHGQSGGGVEVLFPKGAKALYGEPHLIAAF